MTVSDQNHRLEKLENTIDVLLEAKASGRLEEKNNFAVYLSKNFLMAVTLTISILCIIAGGAYQVGHFQSIIENTQAVVIQNGIGINKNGSLMEQLLVKKVEEHALLSQLIIDLKAHMDKLSGK